MCCDGVRQARSKKGLSSTNSGTLIPAQEGLTYEGFSARESASSAAAATFELYTGEGEMRTLIEAPVELGPSESTGIDRRPVDASQGIYVNVLSGTVDVVVYTGKRS